MAEVVELRAGRRTVALSQRHGGVYRRRSGLSDRRVGLRKALGECMNPVWTGCSLSIRTGWRGSVGVIEYLLTGFGFKVLYTGQSEDESGESELVRDMLAMVTSFAGRLYGQRSAGTRRLRAAVTAETECGDAA